MKEPIFVVCTQLASTTFHNSHALLLCKLKDARVGLQSTVAILGEILAGSKQSAEPLVQLETV